MAIKKGDANRLRRAAAEWTDRLLRYPNVFGCGAGQREVGGRRTDEASLVVYVERKLPAEALRSEEMLPREIDTPEGKVRIDVVERLKPHLGVDNAQYRPLEGGCQNLGDREWRLGNAGRGDVRPHRRRRGATHLQSRADADRPTELPPGQHHRVAAGHGLTGRQHQANRAVVQSAAGRLRRESAGARGRRHRCARPHNRCEVPGDRPGEAPVRAAPTV